MNHNDLQQLVEEVSLTYFNKSFNHCATWNNRLKTTGGRYHLKTHNLDFNPKVLEQLGQDVLLSVIKHELCHYHLHLAKQGYCHQDNDFKRLLQQVGGSRFVSWGKRDVKKHHYRCTGCRSDIYRQRQFNIDRFVCSKCRQKFEKIS